MWIVQPLVSDPLPPVTPPCGPDMMRFILLVQM